MVSGGRTSEQVVLSLCLTCEQVGGNVGGGGGTAGGFWVRDLMAMIQGSREFQVQRGWQEGRQNGE